MADEFNQLKHDTESIRQMTDEYLLSIFNAVLAEINKRPALVVTEFARVLKSAADGQ